MAENFHIANLSFLLNYTDGTKKDEIEYELFKTGFQVKGLTHFARGDGASFENLEQERQNELAIITYFTNFIESVYRLNEKKGFEPYIVVGWSDFDINYETFEVYPVMVSYRLLQDLNISGEIKIE